MQCPSCEHEASQEDFGDPLKCPDCGVYYVKALAAKQRREAAQAQSSAQADTTQSRRVVQGNDAPKQGAVIGGWVCLALATALMFWSLFSFFLYLPLFFAAFVLGIVATAQRRLGNGIPILLLSVAVPLVVGVMLGAYRAGEAIVEIDKAAQPSGSAPASATADQQYINQYLELYEFRARYMDSVLDGKVPGVEFKIRNKGSRTLNRVKVVVFFKDASGATIAEEDFVPVSVSEYNFSKSSTPLKPGYIWQQEKGKFYSAKTVPSEWTEGAAEAKITEISFAKESK